MTFEATFVKDGVAIDYTPAADVNAGDVVVLGSIPFIAKNDIEADALGALAAEGVFDVLKDGSSFTAGDAVYWNTTGTPVGGSATGAATSTAAGAYLMGVVVKDAATGDTTVRVKLTAAMRTTTIAGNVTALDITGSDSSLGINGKPEATGTAGGVVIAGGAGTAGNANGGPLTLRGGAKDGSGTDGPIAIGDVNTASISIGVMLTIPTATVAATGSNQSDAAPITTGFTLVTAADATKGVKLPAAAAGLVCIVKNNVAAILKVWPNTDDAINAVAANSNDTLAASTAAFYVAYDATTWYTIPLLGS